MNLSKGDHSSLRGQYSNLLLSSEDRDLAN